MISPDPVRDAAAYQRSLLAALGDDDPAEVQADDAGRHPRAGRRGRAGAADPARAGRVVRARAASTTSSTPSSSWPAATAGSLAHDEPEIIGYDQDLWVARLASRRRRPGGAASRSSRRSGAANLALLGPDDDGRPRPDRPPSRARSRRAST